MFFETTQTDDDLLYIQQAVVEKSPDPTMPVRYLVRDLCTMVQILTVHRSNPGNTRFAYHADLHGSHPAT